MTSSGLPSQAGVSKKREEAEMLFYGIVGAVVFVASVGLVIVMSHAGEAPGRAAVQRSARARNVADR
jgi:hypothetical protein